MYVFLYGLLSLVWLKQDSNTTVYSNTLLPVTLLHVYVCMQLQCMHMHALPLHLSPSGIPLRSDQQINTSNWSRATC